MKDQRETMSKSVEELIERRNKQIDNPAYDLSLTSSHSKQDYKAQQRKV